MSLFSRTMQSFGLNTSLLETIKAEILPPKAQPEPAVLLPEPSVTPSAGWIERDGQHWTIGRVSELVLRNVPASGAVLRLDVEPVTSGPAIKAQILRIRLNGSIADRWALTARGHVTIPLISGGVGCSDLSITLEQPCFFRPSMITGGAEQAGLAFKLHSAEVAPSTNATLSTAQLEWPGKAPERVALEPYRLRLGEYDGAEFDAHWAADDAKGMWATSHASSFEFLNPRASAFSLLQLSLAPARVLSLTHSQRLTVVANGFVISQGCYLSETTIVIALPPEILRGHESLRIVLLMPDAVGLSGFKNDAGWPHLGFLLLAAAVGPSDLPADLGETLRDDELEDANVLMSSAQFASVPLPDLPEAITSTLGQSPGDVMARFESLGDGSAFGHAQKKAGVEVPGLLRFGSAAINAVLEGLSDGFEALHDTSEFSTALADGAPREHLIRVERYGLQWHTFRYEDAVSSRDVLDESAVTLGTLARKFLVDLAAGDKIYVVARTITDRQNLLAPTPDGRSFRLFGREPLRLAEAMALWRALNRNGPRKLLYVVPASAGRAPGHVDCLAPGVYRGHVDSIALSDSPQVEDHADWVRVAASCLGMTQTLADG